MNYSGRETIPRRATARLPPSLSSSSTTSSAYDGGRTTNKITPVDVPRTATRHHGAGSMFRSISSSGRADTLSNEDLINGFRRLYMNDIFGDTNSGGGGSSSLLARRNSRHSLNGGRLLLDDYDSSSGYESNGNISTLGSGSSFPYKQCPQRGHRPEPRTGALSPEIEKVIFRRRASTASGGVPPPAPAARNAVEIFDASSKQDVIKAIDKLDKRITFLREVVLELCEEKNKLYDALAQIDKSCFSTTSATKVANVFSDVDLQDIQASKSSLMQRLAAVEVRLRPTRSLSQESALKRAEHYIDELERALSTTSTTNNRETAARLLAKRKCLAYISSCSSDGPGGTANSGNSSGGGGESSLYSNAPIDETFQRTIISCSLQDQKDLRKRLESVLASFS